jgi:hypothetical protein
MATNVVADCGWTNGLVQLWTSQWTRRFLVCPIALISVDANGIINWFGSNYKQKLYLFSQSVPLISTGSQENVCPADFL